MVDRSRPPIRIRFSQGSVGFMVAGLGFVVWRGIVLARSPEEMRGVPVLELLPEPVIRVIAVVGVPVLGWLVLRASVTMARGAWAVREEGSQMFVRVAPADPVKVVAARDLVDVRLEDRFLRLWFRDGSQASLRRSVLRKEDLSSLFEPEA